MVRVWWDLTFFLAVYLYVSLAFLLRAHSYQISAQHLRSHWTEINTKRPYLQMQSRWWLGLVNLGRGHNAAHSMKMQAKQFAYNPWCLGPGPSWFCPHPGPAKSDTGRITSAEEQAADGRSASWHSHTVGAGASTLLAKISEFLPRISGFFFSSFKLFFYLRISFISYLSCGKQELERHIICVRGGQKGIGENL